MKLYSTLINYAFNYVIQTSKLYNIDESHSLRHSMEVFQYANKIFDNEVALNPYILQQKNIIMCSAILHDMCDKKYVNEIDALANLNNNFKDLLDDEELIVVNKIISSMSYSTVKLKGYPLLNTYNLAYHIVREADLLAAYDVERCIMYQMFIGKSDYLTSLNKVKEVFEKRVLKYIKDDLFITDYSINLANKLEKKALNKLNDIDLLIHDLTNINIYDDL